MLRNFGLRIGIAFGTCAAILTTAQLLSGCKTVTPEQQTQLEKDAALQITCTTGEDCESQVGQGNCLDKPKLSLENPNSKRFHDSNLPFVSRVGCK